MKAGNLVSHALAPAGPHGVNASLRTFLRVCEALRMVSGLVAILVLSAVLAATAVSSRPGGRVEPDRGPASTGYAPAEAGTLPGSGPPGTGFSRIADQGAPALRTVVLYMVRTAEQEDIAHWGEHVDAQSDHDRTYRVVWTSQDLASEGQAIVQSLLQNDESVVVQVVDLRSVKGLLP